MAQDGAEPTVDVPASMLWAVRLAARVGYARSHRSAFEDAGLGTGEANRQLLQDLVQLNDDFADLLVTVLGLVVVAVAAPVGYFSPASNLEAIFLVVVPLVILCGTPLTWKFWQGWRAIKLTKDLGAGRDVH